MKDREVKEKLESLDPLSGGIVFGKEEAWDKLQGHMEQKPARKIPFYYRLAAAAVLLLCISVIGYNFYTPAKQVAVTQPLTPSIITDTEHMVVSTPPATEPIIVTTPETLVIQNNEKRKPRRKQDIPQTKFVVKEELVIVPEPVAAPIIPQPAVVVNTPPKAAVPNIKKMRVVHINDLGKATVQDEPAYVYSSPSLDVSKMKVVSIYDLKREEKMLEQEAMTIVRINRPHNGILSLPNPLNRNNPYDRSFAQNPLNFRLSRNN